MTDKRVKVPEERIKRISQELGWPIPYPETAWIYGDLVDHPIVPTDEQIQRMRERLHPDMTKGEEWFSPDDMARGSILWQRMMFTEPEPEDPLADLVCGEYEEAGRGEHDGVNQRIREAYRRGALQAYGTIEVGSSEVISRQSFRCGPHLLTASDGSHAHCAGNSEQCAWCAREEEAFKRGQQSMIKKEKKP